MKQPESLMRPLEGKAVLVTGAGRGIGAAYAEGAAAMGAFVLVNDIDAALAKETAAKITHAGGKAVAHAADIASPQQARDLVERCIDEFGAIKGLVNNAGLFKPGRLDELTEADIREVLDVNVKGTILCAHYAAKWMMKAKRGSIVNVTSGAHTGLPNVGLYGASKGAVASLTYAWAAELSGTGVRVNAISPSAYTRMSDINDEYRRQRGLPSYSRTPTRVESNVPVVCFLLSDASAGVNGQVVRMEGSQLSLMTHPAILAPVLERTEWTFESVCEAFRTELAARQLPTGIVRLNASVVRSSSS